MFMFYRLLKYLRLIIKSMFLKVIILIILFLWFWVIMINEFLIQLLKINLLSLFFHFFRCSYYYFFLVLTVIECAKFFFITSRFVALLSFVHFWVVELFYSGMGSSALQPIRTLLLFGKIFAIFRCIFKQ